MEVGRQRISRLLNHDVALPVPAQWLAAIGIGGYLCLVPIQTQPDLATLAILLFGFLAVNQRQKLRSGLRWPDYVTISLTLFAASSSSLLSRELGRSLDYFVYVLINLTLLVMAAGLREKRVVKFVMVLIGTCGLMHLFALMLGIKALQVAEPAAVISQTGLATLIVPNDALILGLCLPALVWVLLDSHSRCRMMLSALLAAYAVLSLTVCYAVQSKMALLSLVVAGTTIFFFQYACQIHAADWKKAVGILAGLICLTFIAGGVTWYFGNQSTTRLSLWTEALTAHSSLKEFVFGSGPNTFLFNPSSALPIFERGDHVIPWVHNLFLEAWYEQGALGLLAILMLTSLPVVRALRIRDRNMRAMILASLMSFVVVAAFEVTLTRRFYFAYLALFYGLALAQSPESRNE